VFDENSDRHALLDVEYIFVLAAVQCPLLLLATAMQVVQINRIETFQQRLAHVHERGIVEIAMVRDECENPVASLLDTPLREADELHVVVGQPLRLRGLLQLGALFVLVHQVFDPFALVGRMARIRRVAQHHHHRYVALDARGGLRFVTCPKLAS